MYFDLGDEVGGEGSVVLTGTGAAPPLPPGSWFRTLGSKHTAHCSFHFSPDERCGSEGEQKRGDQSSPTRLTMPTRAQRRYQRAESDLPNSASSFLPVHFWKRQLVSQPLTTPYL